jgi:hypothetical protein
VKESTTMTTARNLTAGTFSRLPFTAADVVTAEQVAEGDEHTADTFVVTARTAEGFVTTAVTDASRVAGPVWVEHTDVPALPAVATADEAAAQFAVVRSEFR